MAFFGNLQSDKYDRQYTDGYLLKRTAQYFAPHRRRMIVIVVLVIVFAITGALYPLLITVGVNALETNAPVEQVTLLAGALLANAIFDYFLYWLRRRLTGRLVGDVIAQLRQDAFSAAVDRDLAFYDDNKSGKVVSRITSDTQEMSQVIIITADILNQVLEFLILGVVLVTLDWRLTLILISLMPIVMLMSVGFRALARRATRQGSRAMAAVNDNIQESVSGISVAKNFRQEQMIYDEFTRVNVQSYTINLRRGFVLALVFPALNGLAGLAIGTILYVGAQYVLDEAINISVWFLFIQAIDRFWFPIINLSAFWSQIQAGFSAIERIFALVDAENTVVQTSTAPAPVLQGAITFKDVLFRYKTGDPVLEHFDLAIRPGENIAFVGHTGAGKSTIAKLIERFYEFQGGEIMLDGVDIRSFDLHSYRRQLGIVPQQPFLFAGTIMDNIRYGRPDAPDADVIAVANSVGEGEWLETLPDGLHSEVGERGARLSMGQRQLVALLRVLLQKPAIFILDEATASIDPFTETQIQEALDMILARSTSILIAHRLSTVRSADRIIVLSEGGIIEQGSHEALMVAGGHYAELYNTYFRHQSLQYVEESRAKFDVSMFTGGA